MMATKTSKAASKKTAAPAKENPNELRITKEQGKSEARKFAELGLSATTLNTVTARIFTKGTMGELDLTESISVMSDKVGKVKAGDMGVLEATLTAQTVSLDAIFNELARRAALNMGEHLHATESYMRLALKAQAQCARTIEVLATIKNPPVVFAKQANITSGPQQVNNGILQNQPHDAHAGKTESQQTKLLTEDQYATLDTTGTAATIGVNQEMETVGAIQRP